MWAKWSRGGSNKSPEFEALEDIERSFNEQMESMNVNTAGDIGEDSVG